MGGRWGSGVKGFLLLLKCAEIIACLYADGKALVEGKRVMWEAKGVTRCPVPRWMWTLSRAAVYTAARQVSRQDRQ